MSQSLNSSQKEYLRSVEVILRRPMARRQKALAVLLLGAPLFGMKAFRVSPAQDDTEESEVITYRIMYLSALLLINIIFDTTTQCVVKIIITNHLIKTIQFKHIKTHN